MRGWAVAAVVVAWLWAAAARPGLEPAPRLALEQVLGRTLCPLRALVDDDPLRLPRRIKFLTCERAPARQCAARRGEPCCGRRGAQCVEVYDKVVVQYLQTAAADPRNATHAVLQVPVGCACVLQMPTPALLEDE